jgi:hypothetical protein
MKSVPKLTPLAIDYTDCAAFRRIVRDEIQVPEVHHNNKNIAVSSVKSVPKKHETAGPYIQNHQLRLHSP